jgi:predicted RNase H-like HicB family nuclease
VAVVSLTVVLHREDDLFVAECPETGTVSQAPTLEEAIANLREATELYPEELPLPVVGKALFASSSCSVGAVYDGFTDS